jgi:hypothetical protein
LATTVWVNPKGLVFEDVKSLNAQPMVAAVKYCFPVVAESPASTLPGLQV